MNIRTIKYLPETYFRRVEFTVRLGCSVGCVFCPQKVFLQATKGEESYLSKETVSRILDNLKGSPIREVHFSGFSEPFLHPECADFIQMTHQAGFEVVVFSTLKGLTGQTLEKIKDIPIKLFHVSIQPPGVNTRPGFSDEETLNQIDLFLSVKNRFFVRFACLDAHYTPEQKAALEKMARQRNLNFRWGEMIDRAGNLPQGKGARHKDSAYLICTRNIGTVILPSGECCWCSMDYGTRHRIGNLRDMPFNEMLCCEPVLKLLRSMRGSCETDNLLCHTCESAKALNTREKRSSVIKSCIFPTTIPCERGNA